MRHYFTHTQYNSTQVTSCEEALGLLLAEMLYSDCLTCVATRLWLSEKKLRRRGSLLLWSLMFGVLGSYISTTTKQTTNFHLAFQRFFVYSVLLQRICVYYFVYYASSCSMVHPGSLQDQKDEVYKLCGITIHSRHHHPQQSVKYSDMIIIFLFVMFNHFHNNMK